MSKHGRMHMHGWSSEKFYKEVLFHKFGDKDNFPEAKDVQRSPASFILQAFLMIMNK
jgi:hypothetical protein